jgi:hypothetical protein
MKPASAFFGMFFVLLCCATAAAQPYYSPAPNPPYYNDPSYMCNRGDLNTYFFSSGDFLLSNESLGSSYDGFVDVFLRKAETEEFIVTGNYGSLVVKIILHDAASVSTRHEVHVGEYIDMVLEMNKVLSYYQEWAGGVPEYFRSETYGPLMFKLPVGSAARFFATIENAEALNGYIVYEVLRTFRFYDVSIRRLLIPDVFQQSCPRFDSKARFTHPNKGLVLVFDGSITPLEDDGSIPVDFVLPQEGSLFIGSLEDDSDGDGLPDVWEEDRGLDPHSAEAFSAGDERALYRRAMSAAGVMPPCLDGVRSLILQ